MASPIATTPENQKAPETSAIRKVLSTKSLGLVKAWENNKKSKVDNKANKKLSNVTAWELSKQAAIDARQKRFEQKLEKKKAVHLEKMQNKIAEIHKEADEKRATLEASQREQVQMVENAAENFRQIAQIPKKKCLCFHC